MKNSTKTFKRRRVRGRGRRGVLGRFGVEWLGVGVAGGRGGEERRGTRRGWVLGGWVFGRGRRGKKEGGGRGVCCTFRPFGPFSEHFKNNSKVKTNFWMFFVRFFQCFCVLGTLFGTGLQIRTYFWMVFVLLLCVFVFRKPFRDGFADQKLTFRCFLCCFTMFFRSLASSSFLC